MTSTGKPQPTDYDEFAEIYDAEYADYPAAAGDTAFYREVAVGVSGPVLEFACGTGRITCELAGAGIDVIGVDISEKMLARARRKVDELPAPHGTVRLHQGDMRSTRIASGLELAIIGFRSFMLLLDTVDQLATLENVRSQLDLRGRLVVSLFVPTLKRLMKYATAQPGEYRFFREFAHPNGVDRIVEHERVSCDELTQIGTHLLRHTTVDGLGQKLDVVERRLVLRWTTPSEMGHLAARAGFETEHIFADYRRTPFGAGSTEMIWVLRKPE